MTCVLFMVLLTTACRTGRNYVDVEGPRYAGDLASQPCTGTPNGRGDASAASAELLVVSFNIEFARNVAGAIDLFMGHPDLRCADVLLLQEMDASGTEAVANALGLSYRYYPAVHSERTDRDFGNAVLSRWPIVADQKLVLPHVSLLTRTQRTATAATLTVGSDTIRVYSAHLGTLAEIGAGARDDQLRTVLDDASTFAHVIVGGDMNSRTVGDVVGEQGFDWPTEEGPATSALGRWDHIFLRGLTSGSEDQGTVLEVEKISDHRPVWVRVRLPR